MEEKGFLNRPLYPFLYGLVFLVYKTLTYPPFFQPVVCLAFVSAFCVTTLIVVSVLRKLDVRIPWFVAFLGWISILHVAAIAHLAGYAYTEVPGLFYAWFYLATITILVLISRRADRLHSSARRLGRNLLNTLVGILLMAVFLKGSVGFNADRGHVPVRSWSVAHVKPGAPDVIWLLLDEYGSSRSLHHEFGFYNSLDDSLHALGFVEPVNIRSSSDATEFSVLSIFNQGDTIRPKNFCQGTALLRRSNVVPALERAGYRFVNLGPFNIAGHPPLQNRSGYPQDYFDMIMAGTLPGMIVLEWKYSAIGSDRYNQLVFKRLDEELSHPGPQPRFIWAHVLSPHAPYCRDRNGRPEADPDPQRPGNRIREYIEAIEYVNKCVLELWRRHPRLSRETVVISADHGARFRFLRDPDDRFKPFCAVRKANQTQSKVGIDATMLSDLPRIIFN